MDVDMLNSSSSPSSAADHSLDMMTIMMQMEKSPEFCNNHFYHNTPTYPEINFSTSGTNSTSTTNNLTNSPLPIFHNPSNSSVSVLTNPIQEPNVVIPSERFKNGRAVLYPNSYENKKNSMAAMREMIFRIASMQPIHIDPESIKPPKRRNVKISKDPQSVAARHRRERISERIRILQRLVPGGTKMDTASMLDEAIHYVKFLKKQVQNLEQAGASTTGFTGTQLGSNVNYSNFMKACQPPSHQMTVGSIQMLR